MLTRTHEPAKRLFQVEIIDTLEKMSLLEEVWDDVLSRSGSEHVSLTFEWFQCWCRAFGKGKQLFTLVVRDERTEVIGIAPLMISRERHEGVPLKKLGFIYNDNASRADFIICRRREEVLQAIFECLDAHQFLWDIMLWENMAEESPNYQALRALCRTTYRYCAIKQGLRTPFITIQTTWECYLATRSQRFRRRWGKSDQMIHQDPAYAIKKLGGVVHERQRWESICEVSRKSWKADYGRDISATEQNKIFFEQLNQTFGRRGEQDIWLFEKDGKTLAYEYVLTYKNKAYTLRADFDRAYGTLTPGAILSLSLVKHYFDNAFEEIDLCGNDEPYKKRFTERAREHHTLIIYKNSLGGACLYLYAFKIGNAIKSYLKKFPAVRKVKMLLARKYTVRS